MTCSQKRLPPQKQRYQLGTAMTPQQYAFAATVPNMIPRLAATPMENTSDCVTSFPGPETKHYGSYPDMPSVVSCPPDNAYKWLDPHLNLLPHWPELPSSPAMYNNTFGLSSGMTAVNLASHNSNAQAASLPVLSRQVQGVSLAGNTTQPAPSLPKPTGKTVSRLPSNEIPRKAPLQGKSNAGISLPRNTSRKFPKPRQQRSTSQPETLTRATSSEQKRSPSPSDARQGTPVLPPIVPAEASRAKKRPRNDREESHDVEMVEVKKIGGDGAEKINSAETTSSAKVPNEEERTRTNASHRRPAKKRATRATSPTQSSHHHRRPMYEYEVPLEVEGIRKALGSDNWDEYVYLLESLWLHKVTAHEFEQGTKPLFQIEYDTIRKKMNSMVVKKMIMPRLEEIGKDLP